MGRIAKTTRLFIFGKLLGILNPVKSGVITRKKVNRGDDDMNNQELLNQAIELLKTVNPDELETVQVNHTKFDDGSVGFTVELTYPGEGDVFFKPEISE